MERDPFIIMENETGVIDICTFLLNPSGLNIIATLPKGKEEKIAVVIPLKDEESYYHVMNSNIELRYFLKKNLPNLGYTLLEKTDKRIPNELLSRIKKSSKPNKKGRGTRRRRRTH